MTTTTTPIQDLLSGPLETFKSIDGMAEELLSRFAAEPAAQSAIEFADLPNRQAQRLIRPLLACLALKSEAETGTSVNAYGGTLTFIRPGKVGSVRITGEFENSPGKVRLAFRRPEPFTPAPALLMTPRGSATAPALVDVLNPVVGKFRVEATGFDLATDLARLDRVRAAGAVEAVILYSTRIVESMARAAIEPAAGSSCQELSGILRELVEYQAMPRALKRWLDLLWNLGNDARHATRPLSAADADVAFEILLRWLHWTFCEAARGPRLKTLAAANQPADALLPRELAKLMDAADSASAEVLALLTDPTPDANPALLTPVIPAAAAEALLSRSRSEDARALLEVALKRFPRDLRLRQLLGLYWSRRGEDEVSIEHLNRARKELEPLRPAGSGSAADDETFGMLGGVYKRLAELDQANAADWLKKSQRTYREGWERSGHENNYLGINAATMAVLQGQPAEVAEVLAEPIRNRLVNLQERLRAGGGPASPLTYWDQVTWAEAELLLCNWSGTGELYRDAFTRFATRTMDIETSVKQAQRILDRLGQADRAREVLGKWAE